MNYELAKQLKEAGFPRHWVPATRRVKINGEYSLAGVYNMPPLEELIEACGIPFKRLRKIIDQRNGKITFKATARGKKGNLPDTIGKTPTEAVAKLWLQLNKKD